MPRPCKRRRICAEPACDHFGPKGSENHSRSSITMTLDEFECIRLIDLEGLTQEECARQMEVSRTTAQAIYGSARAKLAECLVHGRELKIEGGDYVLCDGGNASNGWCGRSCWKRSESHTLTSTPASTKQQTNAANPNTLNTMEEIPMKIAVTYENGQVFQHFGHTENFKIYEVENNEIKSSAIVSTNGSGHGALAGFLQEYGISVLICGGIGGGARMALAQAGIELYPGASGDADACVASLLAGSLSYNPDTVCNHHHSGGHDCSHHAGNHECGHGEGHGCGHEH